MFVTALVSTSHSDYPRLWLHVIVKYLPHILSTDGTANSCSKKDNQIMTKHQALRELCFLVNFGHSEVPDFALSKN